jgi:hypothetical protein
VTNRKEPEYHKMGQVRWLVDKIRDACMWEWTLGKYIMVDEMMICYKGIARHDNTCQRSHRSGE